MRGYRWPQRRREKRFAQATHRPGATGCGRCPDRRREYRGEGRAPVARGAPEVRHVVSRGRVVRLDERRRKRRVRVAPPAQVVRKRNQREGRRSARGSGLEGKRNQNTSGTVRW